MTENDEKTRGFTVKDRRTVGAEEKPAGGAKEAEPRAEERAEPVSPEGDRPLPEIDFSTFILSLATSAFYHLGQLPHPDTQKTELNLPLAKQTIDMLGMLQAKTRGNLSHDEDRLLENVLYDLRLKYVEASKK